MFVQKLKLGAIVATALAMLTVGAVRVSRQFGGGTPAPTPPIRQRHSRSRRIKNRARMG